MRVPTLPSRARRIGNLFRVANGADRDSAPVLLVVLVLRASMGASGVAAAGPLGPSPGVAQPAGDEDDAGDEPGDTGLPLEVDRLVPLDMTEGS